MDIKGWMFAGGGLFLSMVVTTMLMSGDVTRMRNQELAKKQAECAQKQAAAVNTPEGQPAPSMTQLDAQGNPIDADPSQTDDGCANSDTQPGTNDPSANPYPENTDPYSQPSAADPYASTSPNSADPYSAQQQVDPAATEQGTQDPYASPDAAATSDSYAAGDPYTQEGTPSDQPMAMP